MDENNEKSKNTNYLSNLGSLIKKQSESIGNKLIDKISDIIDKSKLTKQVDKETFSSNQSDKKLILNKRENSQIQNLLTIQEDEDHKIFKYCLDYDEDEEEEEDVMDDDESDEVKEDLTEKKSPNKYNHTNKQKSPPIVKKSSTEIMTDTTKHMKMHIDNSTNKNSVTNQDKKQETNLTISPKIKYNFDKFKLDSHKNTFSHNKDNYDDLEYVTTCHRIYTQGSLVDLEGFKYFECQRIKKKNKLFSYIGLGENNTKKEKCSILIDEYFIYFLFDKFTQIPRYTVETIKIVGKHYDIRKISNIDAKEEKENILRIRLVFNMSANSIHDYQSKVKEIEIERNVAIEFIACLKLQLTKHNIPLLI